MAKKSLYPVKFRLELERGRVVLGGTSYGGTTVARREDSKHLSPCRSIRVHPEPCGGLGPDRSLAVVSGRDLDIDASAPPLRVDVLDLRIGIEHASLRVDGQTELPGGVVPLGVGGPPAGSRADGLAPACDGALEFVVEAHAPDGGALCEQALAFAAAGPVDGPVVCELGVLEEPRGGPDVLSGSRPCSAARPQMAAAPLRVSVRTLNGVPFGPLAVDSLASPWRIQAFTARRVV